MANRFDEVAKHLAPTSRKECSMRRLSTATRLLPLLATLLFGTSLLGAPPVVAVGNPHANGEGTIGAGAFQISLNAIQHKDGTVTGSLVVHDELGTWVLEIACLNIIGNRAILSGTIVAADGPNAPFVGYAGVFSVEDNGQGRNAPPDRMSLVLLEPTPFDCFDPSVIDNIPPFIPLDSGNLNVKGT